MVKTSDKQKTEVQLVEELQEPEEQRKWAVESLQASEEKYRAILENIEEAYYEVDLAGNFTFFNSMLCQMLGYTADELMGANYRRYTDDVYADMVYRIFNKVYRTGEPTRILDWEVNSKDGARKLVESSVSLIRDAAGKPVGFRGIVRDVTGRKWTEAEIVKLNRELTTLNRVGQALTSALDLEETLTLITEQVTNLLGVEATSVILHDEVQDDLCFAAASGSGADFILNARFELGQGIAGWVVQHGEAAVVPDVSRDVRWFRDFDHKSGLETRSILCVPLRAKGQIIGAIEAVNKWDGDFDQDDLRLLTSLAAPAATAIENARLFGQSQARAEELAVLNELGQALTAHLDVEGVLDEAYRGVSRLMDTTNFYVALCEPGEEEVTFAIDVLEGEVRRSRETRRAGRGLTEHVIQTREPLLIEEELPERLEELGIALIGRIALSWLGVPLVVGDQVLGVMAVQSYTRPRLYGQRERDLLVSVASQAAIAIENARSYEQEQARAKELAVLNELSQSLTASLSVEDVLEEAYRQAARLVDTTNFYIGLYDSDKEEVAIPFIVSKSEIDRHITVVPADQGFTGYIIRNRTAVLVEENVIEWLEENGISVIGEPALSWLGVPLIVGDQVLGVMAVQSYITPRLYGEHDRKLLTAIAGPTAIAIQNARLYEQAQREIGERKRAEAEVRRRAEQAALTYKVGQRVSGELALDELLSEIVIAVHDAFDYYGVMLLLEGEAGFLTLQSAAGGYIDVLPTDIEIAVGEGMIGRAAASGVAQVSNDVSQNPYYVRNANEDTKSELAVPIESGGRVIGVLDLQSDELDAFDETDVMLMETLADQVGVVIENARLYEEIQRELAERERMEGVLQETHEELEKYTTILERQTARLRVGAEVTRKVSAILDVRQLLEETVRLISNEFGFYHSAVFLVGESGEYAILRAASSAGGRRMVERGYRVPLGGKDAVGYVAATGEHCIALDVGEGAAMLPFDRGGAVAFNNPDLSDTRSEMALPLRMRGRTIGVLDIQSTQEAAFSEEDVAGFQTLADQLAVSIDNARLVERTGEQLREQERLYGEYSASAWAELLSPVRPLGYIYDRIDVSPILDSPAPLDLAPQRVEAETTGAILTMPLKVRGRTVGILGVEESDAAREWSSEEVAIVEAVSDQVAMALDSARLFGEARTRAEELAVLNELAQSLTARLTVDDVLEETYQGVSRLLDTTNFYIGLYDPQKNEISFPFNITESAVDEQIVAISADQGYAGYIMRNRTSLLLTEDTIEQVVERTAKMGIEHIGQLALSYLGVPLVVGDRVLGVMAVQNYTVPHVYSEHDRNLLTAIASQAAIALQSAHLFEEAQRRAAQLAAAAEVARDATAILEVDQLLDETVHLISEQFGFYHAGVFLLDERGEYAVLQAASSEGGRRMLERGHRLKVGEVGIVGYAAATGEPRVALDVGQDAVHFAHDDLPDTRSEMGLPLKVRERVIGVLDVQSDQTAAFSADDVAALQTMADQLAIAIANARLFQETRSDVLRRALINEVLQAATASLDPEELLHQAGEVISRRLESPTALFVWEAEDKVFRTVAVHDSQAADVSLPGVFQQVTRGVAPVLFEAAESRRTAVLELTSDASGPLVTAARWARAQSIIYVPLISRDQVLGLLGIGKLEEQPVVDVEFTELVAANLTVAVENARLYQEAVQTAERLAEVDRLKSQFLANMSHELRTPLNSIIGFSRVILKEIDGPLTDMQRTDLQSVYDSGQHLLGLINDILEVAKIESGRMDLVSEVVNLQDIIRGVMSTAIALVKDKPAVELQQSVPQDLPTIMGDTRRIRQAILNLVSNAAKFTTEGFIRVEAEVVDTEVIVSVADSGVGIPPDKIDMIFEPFTQADASTTRETGGTGLGLSITSSFVEMHGGRMWVESEVGKGSTFYMALPIHTLSSIEEQVEEEQPELEPGQRVVLCVEDDEGVITLFRRYLSKRGYRVVGLSNSMMALERARELQPFAITLDVMMPGKDGWQVVQELKADPATSDIPVIMCTIVGEEEHGLSLGAADYLIKPILEQDLLAALNRLDRQDERHLVLVVDDLPEDRDLLSRMIESQEGYEVMGAGGGEEAIAMIRQTLPDIIILDLMMPNVDGFAVLEAVKTDENTRSIPIIVVTAKDLTPEEREVLTGEVESLLHKGIFDRQELLADVAGALERLRGKVGD